MQPAASGGSTMPARIEVLSTDSPVNMADQWYEYATPKHFWMQWRFEVLRLLLAKYELGKSLVEIGCGNCVARDQLEEFLSIPVDGCDLNRASLELAGPASGRQFLYNIFDQRPEWHEYFSTVFLLDTLEHIEDPIAFLRSIHNHTRPNGYVVINVPALGVLRSKYDDVAGHVKRYSKAILSAELNASDYRLVEAHYWGFSMIPVLAVRKVLGAFLPRERIIEVGFQPSSGIVDGCLRLLMKAELATLSNPSVGTSLVAIARRV
jgi:2-polyprenyl-3-methyl-5-hydroxy-6-metoxy-1,4-benzoquinol methylase